MTAEPSIAHDLIDFIDKSPSPWHCADQAARRLEASGAQALSEGNAWSLESGGRYFVVRDGALVAFRLGTAPASDAGFRIIGAHTDSPNLRVKPNPDAASVGYAQLGVEVYGGALTHTWLDRDLGLAGRVAVQHGTRPADVRTALVHVDQPILRIPSLAIHLNRDIQTDGLKLNAQDHLTPILALNAPGAPSGRLRSLLADTLEVSAEQILAWDLCLVDVVPSCLGGLDGDMIFAPRLDNQAMCHAAVVAFTRCLDTPSASTAVICLYDHEEVGSASCGGADGTLVASVLSRIANDEGPGAHPAGLPRAIARSYQVSADMAHAVHPNYKDKHDPEHHPKLNGGPVIKLNASQRYATSAETSGLFESLCKEAEVPYQKFVNRTDLQCGSTIGPISAARLGLRTVDVGNPMLSMHSIREQAGADDPAPMTDVLTRFLSFSAKAQ